MQRMQRIKKAKNVNKATIAKCARNEKKVFPKM